MAKRRRQTQVIPAHAEAIARTAASSVGIGWEILLPIVVDVIGKLLPQLMGCLTPQKTAAEALGYDGNDAAGEFSRFAIRKATMQARVSAKQAGVKLNSVQLAWLADAHLREAIRPTTNLTACAAELTVSTGE